MTLSRNMDVFALRDAVIAEYEQFATSFTTIRATDIRQQVDALYAEKRYWPEPLIQINPSYKRTTTVAELVAAGGLDAGCAAIFPLSLYKHQEEAIALAGTGTSYVVTTGTGSGKSLCFFIPIVSSVLAEKRLSAARRTRAIVIYPMNALANSQLEELAKYLPDRPGGRPVTFARYTGQESDELRKRIADDPPDILLTNFMMLELLMTRQDEIDRKVIGNCAGLRFLVLDEFHTYRGRQGADVALLVRRIRERLSSHVQCIGTSATMKSDGSAEERAVAVAAVAAKIFATHISPDCVIGETLERVTDPTRTRETVRPALGPAIDAGVPQTLSDSELRVHPLAIWVETCLGVQSTDDMPAWHRAPPLALADACQKLSADSGRDRDACAKALRDLLLVSSLRECDRVPASTREQSFFAFKLHQFVSGAGHAFATLELPGMRRVTVEGQQFHPDAPEHRLYATHFCRECGQEYHPVRLVQEDGERRVLFRDIDDAPPTADEEKENEKARERDEDADSEKVGFLTIRTPDLDAAFTGALAEYPEAWRDNDAAGDTRLKREYRRAKAQDLRVEPTGRVGSGTPAWFLPGKFRFCLFCDDTHSGPGRDRTRLASLSAEGRSSATTVLVGSVLRWMHGGGSGLSAYTRKLLGFTDNRQDAALQAGHFNDFLFVSLVRAGFLGALDAAGEEGLGTEQLGVAQQRALGFHRPDPQLRAEWLAQPDLIGVHRLEAEKTLREVLAYRAWFDQRRGWRYTNPNLEQLGLLAVTYEGIDELAKDDARFADAPPLLARATPAVRERVYQVLFDHLRTWMAIRSQVLDQILVEQLATRSGSFLRAPWGFAKDEKPRQGRWLIVRAPTRRDLHARDEDLIVRGSSRSGLGKKLKSSRLWQTDAIREVKTAELDQIIVTLLEVATLYGQVVEEATPFDVPGWKLSDAAIRFRRGDPSLRTERKHDNDFFSAFYQNLAAMLASRDNPLFGFEAREHTAQVEQKRREVREKRFRFGVKEQAELKEMEREKKLQTLSETDRFLPVLFCSPTMELGVDISDMNVVYLRNVPPTPANYAQRSGRAGRSGQAALVLTYASSQGPHDQYFFRDPKAMVHGQVRAPMLDLANRELIDSHLQAVWLACTEQPIDSSISALLVLADPARPLRANLRAALGKRTVTDEAVTRMARVLEMVEGELTRETARWYTGRDAYARSVAEEALARFESAFDRWRHLFRAAENQRDAADRLVRDHAAPAVEKRAAKGRWLQAIEQLELLQQGDESQSAGDFYTYRYLATEGFLPGYNFPRLPLLAYIPRVDGGGRQTYLQRPRFLALSEFGPRSLVYHEGRAFRVVRAMLSVGHRGAADIDTRLPTEVARLCSVCGAGHFDEVSLCQACRAPLGNATVVNNVYRIENVDTYPAERITANDEERQRQGFDLQTTFQWAVREGVVDAREGAAEDAQGTVVDLAYGPGARITRLNKGLRRRANKSELGFWIDPISGRWTTMDEDSGPATPTTAVPQLIVPCVRDHKNALLVRPRGDDLSPRTLATVQYALLRGVEAEYQLEEGEILAEPMPSRDTRSGFLLYEATEGGAGVLTRIVSETDSLGRVARQALRMMHYDIPESGPLPGDAAALANVPDTSCVAGCYRCLLSYYNQPDHALVDRRDEGAKALLLRLATSTTRGLHPATDAALAHPAEPPVPGTPDSPPVREVASTWLAQARARALPAPDSEPLVLGGVTVPICWRAHYVVAALGDMPAAVRQALSDQGLEVIDFGDAATWPLAFTRLARALGRNA